jgi:hypothetical protein
MLQRRSIKEQLVDLKKDGPLYKMKQLIKGEIKMEDDQLLWIGEYFDYLQLEDEYVETVLIDVDGNVLTS